MFKLLLALLVCFGFAISSADAKTKKKNHHKAEDKMAFSVNLGGFKNQRKDKQLALIKALREWEVTAEAMHRLKGIDAKNAFLFNLIEQAYAQETPDSESDKPKEKKDRLPYGTDQGQICTFAGWFTRTTGSTSRAVCRHPEDAGDSEFPYNTGLCIGNGRNKATDALNGKILCNPFLAGEPKDNKDKSRCVGFGSPTKSCMDLEGSLEAAVRYAIEHENEFEKYLGRALDFCEGTKAIEAKDGVDAEVTEIANGRVRADQIATCKNLMTRLNEVKANIEPAKKAAEMANDIKVAEVKDADGICVFNSGGTEYQVSTRENGSKLIVRTKEGLPIAKEYAVTKRRVSDGKNNGYKISTALGYLEFYQRTSGRDAGECNGSWISLDPVGGKDSTDGTTENGWSSCEYTRSGLTGSQFKVSWEKSGADKCKVSELANSQWRELVEGKMTGGECLLKIDGKYGLPIVYKSKVNGNTVECTKGQFSIPMDKSGGAAGGDKGNLGTH